MLHIFSWFRKIRASYGLSLDGYPNKIKDSIVNNVLKVKGNKGDLVIFDKRSFHGPDQPSKSDRFVYIFEYIKKKHSEILLNVLHH